MGKVVDERVRDEEHYLRWIFDRETIVRFFGLRGDIEC